MCDSWMECMIHIYCSSRGGPLWLWCPFGLCLHAAEGGGWDVNPTVIILLPQCRTERQEGTSTQPRGLEVNSTVVILLPQVGAHGREPTQEQCTNPFFLVLFSP